MGVSGSGKTTLGKGLAKHFSMPFFDADDFHPESNIEKMNHGIPLNDDDRWPWLAKLNSLLKDNLGEGCILACSALKASYRHRLTNGFETEVQLVYLKGSYDVIYQRMVMRENHFMPAELLQSQFDALEEPKNALVLDCDQSLEEMIGKIKKEVA